MKIKISKILGVSLALVMVFSLFSVFAPVKQAQAVEGEMQWVAQPLPGVGNVNGNVLDNGANAAIATYFAVGPDGLTIYAIDSAVTDNATPAGCLLKSVDGGQTFSTLPNPGGALGGILSYVAVSPTNPSVVAVVENRALSSLVDQVFVSTNGGTTWTGLSAINIVPPPAATARITGVAVSPDRADSLLGRDYFVSVADSAAGAVAGVNGLQVIGATPNVAWVSFGTATWDYATVALSPNYLSDHAVAFIRADVATGTQVEVWNNFEPAAAPLVYPGFAFPRLLSNAAFEVGAAGTGVTAADIALPSDFDPTTPTGMRFWVSYASGVAEPTAGAGSVYRVDSAQTADLLSPTGLVGTRIKSIAYSGTVASGTLFAGWQTPGTVAGVALTGPVQYTTTPQINLPLWTPSLKSPTGNAGLPVVRVSPNFTTDKKVYAMTVGAESAFSISPDAGVSFNQEAIINVGAAVFAAAFDDLIMTGDGTTLFATALDAAGFMSLWKTTTPPIPASWSRIWCAAAANRCRIAINKGGWATAPEIYVYNTVVGTPNGLFASYDGGATFNVRSTPLAFNNNLGVASSKVIYVASGAGAAANATNVYKSTNGGAVWGSPIPANVGRIVSVVPIGNDVLVGGAGLASRSTDGGASYALLPLGLNAAGFYLVIPDSTYMTSKIIYAFGVQVLGTDFGVYRVNADTGTLWENILAPTNLGRISAGQSNGVLYAPYQGGVVAGCDRAINPLDPVGTVVWGTMDQPAGAVPTAMNRFAMGANKVYGGEIVAGVPILWAYNDYMATRKTTINSPAGGATISVNPITGTANPLIVSWNAIGTSTGLARNYTFLIYETAQGSGAGVFINTNPLAGPWLLGPQLTSPRNTIMPYTSLSGGILAPAAPDILYTFVPGVQYSVMIRANDELSGDLIVSQWSDPVTFTIAAASYTVGPTLQAPILGGTDVPVKPGFTWAAITDMVKWEFELSTNPATTARGYFIDALVGLTGANALVTPGWQCDITLDYGTNYFWHVQGINATGGTTPWATGTFTTIAAGVFTCPLDGLTFATQAELAAHNATAHAPVIPQTPAYIWAVVIIGAILVVVVIALIFTTRRVP